MTTDIMFQPSNYSTVRHGRIDGFTLTELLITIAISAILLAIGIPSFTGFILGQRVKTASSDIAYAASFARSEAIKRNREVVVAAATTGWQDGWSVKVDDVMLSQQAPYSGVTISGPVDLTFTYTGSGRPSAAVAPFQISGSTSVRCVTIDLSGLPSSKTGSC